jgi:hypothetical protein
MSDNDSLMEDSVADVESLSVSISSIYEDDMIEKFTGDDGKPRWKCKWCATSFAGWNATKALRHVNKVANCSVKVCTGKIDKQHASLYKVLYDKAIKKNRC